MTTFWKQVAMAGTGAVVLMLATPVVLADGPVSPEGSHFVMQTHSGRQVLVVFEAEGQIVVTTPEDTPLPNFNPNEWEMGWSMDAAGAVTVSNVLLDDLGEPLSAVCDPWPDYQSGEDLAFTSLCWVPDEGGTNFSDNYSRVQYLHA